MATRNILDINGDVIGTLTLPDSTTEDQWTAALAVYATNPPIPDVTPRQIRLALIASGVTLSSIDSAIASMPNPTNSIAQATWDYSLAFERNNPLVAEVAAMLGWTSEQLDALWALALTL